MNLKSSSKLILELGRLPPPEAAQRLLGCYLLRQEKGRILKGRIVETESYHEDDAASHSYKRRTARTEVMFGPSGYAYVYFTYGMHYCMNVVTGKKGRGEAVLIRALEPISGRIEMEINRKSSAGVSLTNGPAKLCQALNIDTSLNGHDLQKQPLQLTDGELSEQEEIVKTVRIGISSAKDEILRFYIKNSKYVSVK